nr:DUF4037 domain-containing protein [Salirhabdus salicampi]
MLAGSVSRGWHDKYSDIELNLFWAERITDEDRKQPIEKVEGNLLSYHPYEEEEWSESYITNGMKIEVSSFLTSTVENVIRDVVERYDTDYGKQCIVTAVKTGIGLFGENKIKAMREKVDSYPVQLYEKMIIANLDFGNQWNNRNGLLQRKDWVMLYDVINTIQRKLFGILFGLNHMYIQHPQFKWMQNTIDQMNIKPKRLVEQMENVLLDTPTNGLRELETLIKEVLLLVERHMPHLPLEEHKQLIYYAK